MSDDARIIGDNKIHKAEDVFEQNMRKRKTEKRKRKTEERTKKTGKTEKFIEKKKPGTDQENIAMEVCSKVTRCIRWLVLRSLCSRESKDLSYSVEQEKNYNY